MSNPIWTRPTIDCFEEEGFDARFFRELNEYYGIVGIKPVPELSLDELFMQDFLRIRNDAIRIAGVAA